ncbi:MAG: hypothetical protein NTU63_02190 [Candidatus Pacearchaeota archaeon]|nr:hypothetical protein [Candidatus Pacearchaeota archaeon]
MEKPSLSIREERVRRITHVYYSRPDIQKTIFDFSFGREICPRYFEGFGKRPDSLQYPTDILGLVRKGATSFHCSEELWANPLSLSTDLNEKELNELRIGWDLLIDIDSKYFDYSKILAELIVEVLNFHGVKNVGIKFSGSKGFHLIVPWKAFPEKMNNLKTSDMFPQYPRIITKYIAHLTNRKLIEKVSALTKTNQYVKDFQASKEVLPDVILVSPRHLFRMPYSLHEKTSLVSVVINQNKIKDFQLKDADPLKIEIKNFFPKSKEGEATELLMQALDWYKENNPEEEKKNIEFKPIKITDRSEKNFPPCVKKILQGVQDGKKRSLFVLINLFRSIGAEKDELEKIISAWNAKNESPLHQGYIKSQISWAIRRKPILPPNCNEFYKNLGVCSPDELCKFVKNPLNYVVRKNFIANQSLSRKNKDNFKNKN